MQRDVRNVRGNTSEAASYLRKPLQEIRNRKEDIQGLLAELKTCKSLQTGKDIHAEAVKNGTVSCIYVGTALVKMYSKYGSVFDARKVFDTIKRPDVVSWNNLILGYAANGQGDTALELFSRMKSQGCVPNSFTFVSALKACTSLALEKDGSGRAACLEQGREIHQQVGCHTNMYVQSTLVEMYSKCGCMSEARKVFDSIKDPDVVLWTALILGYADNGEGSIAMGLFSRMKSRGIAPNPFTFVAAIRACTALSLDQNGPGREKCLVLGREIHSGIDCQFDMYLQSSLIDMYAKCGSMFDAHKVFGSIRNPDVVSWTALILGYAENGEGGTALDMFSRMRSQGCTPNTFTFVAALKACGCLALEEGSNKDECLEWGKEIHSLIGMQSSTYVLSTMVDVYAKCGAMVEAQQFFDSINKPDVVSWTSLILGYAENGGSVVALDLFSKMKTQGCIPDSFSFVAALKACSFLGALESGKKIHAEIDIQLNKNLVNSLVDFYAKCGSLVEAQKVFDENPTMRDLKTWTSLLGGYSGLGDTKAVFELLEGMVEAGFQPSSITFLCILSCCTHAGFVERARECFESMSWKYGIVPSIEHYTCMVDVLGRSNMLDDAMALLHRMPWRPDTVTWMTVLNSCRKQKNVGIGRLAFTSLICLADIDAAGYVLMAEIYGSRGMWREQEMVMGLRKKTKASGVEKSCWTERTGRVHVFCTYGTNL